MQENMDAQRALVIDVLRRGPLSADDYRRELGAGSKQSKPLSGINPHAVARGAILRKRSVHSMGEREPPLAVKTDPGRTNGQRLFVLNPDHPMVQAEIAPDTLASWRELLPSDQSSSDEEDDRWQGFTEEERVLVLVRDVIAALREEEAVKCWFTHDVFPVLLLRRLLPLAEVQASVEDVFRELIGQRLVQNESQDKRPGPSDDWSVYSVREGTRLREHFGPADADHGHVVLHKLLKSMKKKERDSWLRALRDRTIAHSFLGPQKPIPNRRARRAKAEGQETIEAPCREDLQVNETPVDAADIIGLLRRSLQVYSDTDLRERVRAMEAVLAGRGVNADVAHEPIEVMIGVYADEFEHQTDAELARQTGLLRFELRRRNIEADRKRIGESVAAMRGVLAKAQDDAATAEKALAAAAETLKRHTATMKRFDADLGKLDREMNELRLSVLRDAGVPIPK